MDWGSICRCAFRHFCRFIALHLCTFMKNMVITNDMYLSFWLFFILCSEPPMGISSVGSFLVWSGGSLITFSALLGVGS